MAQIWEYITNYNPTGFYEDNRAKDLKNSYMSSQISAANMKNAREKKIMDLQDAWANGDEEALRQIGIYSPETTKKYIENADEMLSIARPMAESVLKVAPENRAKAYQQMLQGLRNKNVDVSDMPVEYDEGMMQTLANSDPQKIRDERLNEMTEQRAQNAFNRGLYQLQYQNALANQKAEEARNRALGALEANKEYMSPQEYARASAAIMGAEFTPQSDLERMTQDYLSGQMTPEDSATFLTRVQGLKQAQSGKTPDNAKALYNISKMDVTPDVKAQIARDAGLGEYDFTKPVEEFAIADALKEKYPELTDEQALGLAFKNKGTSVTVNTGEGATAFDKEMGKKDAAVVAKGEEDIAEIENQMPLLEQMKEAVADPALYQGTGGNAINKLRVAYASALRAAGKSEDEINAVKGLDSASILNTGSAMLKGRIRKDLMPGPLSDRDLAFLIEMTPSLTKTDTQNAAIINMYQKMYDKQLQMLEFKNNYARQNKTLNGWRRAAREAGLDRPIFTEEEKRFVKMSPKKAREYSPPMTNQQRSGLQLGTVVDGYRYLGGDPNNETSWEKE